jgi:hypothetical protein
VRHTVISWGAFLFRTAFAVKASGWPGSVGRERYEAEYRSTRVGGHPRDPMADTAGAASFSKKFLGSSDDNNKLSKCTTLILREIGMHSNYRINSTTIIYQC